MGDQNLWADLLTRWAAPGNATFPARRIGALKVPLITKDLQGLPSLKVISGSQKKSPPSENGFSLSREGTIEVWKTLLVNFTFLTKINLFN